MSHFALAMCFVALAILDFEKHKLEGITTFYYNILMDGGPMVLSGAM